MKVNLSGTLIYYNKLYLLNLQARAKWFGVLVVVAVSLVAILEMVNE